ncbi:hypothetical protein AACH28_04765 [Sphingobacterium thalpophilum]|uniref:Uncharacterized protein n=1 Tax=Sphingobacterium thalpophilum TaxID=259 RepID=A0ACD5C4V8_9SPHI|nr:hypothetical protein [Sphingobacterium multivorum]
MNIKNKFILIILILSGCGKNEPKPDNEEKLYSKSITFTTNISSSEFEVVNTETQRKVIKKTDLKPTSQVSEIGGIRFIYNETLKVKAAENLRIILPYHQSRKYITVSVVGGDFSGMQTLTTDKIQYLDFKMATKLYD